MVAVYTSVCYSPSLCVEEGEIPWTFGNEEEDEGVLSTLLDSSSWDVEETPEYQDTLFEDEEEQQLSAEEVKDSKARDGGCCMT